MFREEEPTVINLLILAHGNLLDIQTYNSRSNDVNPNIFFIQERKMGLNSLVLNNIMIDETYESSNITREDIDIIVKNAETEYRKSGTVVNQDLLDFLNKQQDVAKKMHIQQLEERYETHMRAWKSIKDYNSAYPENKMDTVPRPTIPISEHTYNFVMKNNVTKAIDKQYSFYTGREYSGIPPFVIYCSNPELTDLINTNIYGNGRKLNIKLSELIDIISHGCLQSNISNVVINILDTSCNALKKRGNSTYNETFSGVVNKKYKTGGKKYKKTKKTKKQEKTRKNKKK